MRFTTRELSILAVFGALWGLVEISLGAALHALRLPFSGALLAAAGLTIALTGRWFVPRRGSTLFIGAIAMLLKLFSIGSAVIGPLIGILAEALLAEAALLFFRRPSRAGFVLAASLGVLWTLIQPFFTGWLLFGRDLFVVWLELLQAGSRLVGLESSATVGIIAVLAAAHLVIGAAGGWLAWSAGRLLGARLGKTAWVGLLVALILAACAQPTPAETTGPTLTVTDGQTTKHYTLADLEQIGQEQAAFRDVNYRGVRLSALLSDAGFDPAALKAVTATAADGFSASYEPAIFTKADTLLAYARADGPLVEDEGPFRMVVPGQEGKLNPRQVVEIRAIP